MALRCDIPKSLSIAGLLVMVLLIQTFADIDPPLERIKVFKLDVTSKASITYSIGQQVRRASPGYTLHGKLYLNELKRKEDALLWLRLSLEGVLRKTLGMEDVGDAEEEEAELSSSVAFFGDEKHEVRLRLISYPVDESYEGLEALTLSALSLFLCYSTSPPEHISWLQPSSTVNVSSLDSYELPKLPINLTLSSWSRDKAKVYYNYTVDSTATVLKGVHLRNRGSLELTCGLSDEELKELELKVRLKQGYQGIESIVKPISSSSTLVLRLGSIR